MSIESNIAFRVEKEIDNREITIVATPIDTLEWPRGTGAMSTRGFIIVNDKFFKFDSDACVFSVKHEIGHLNNRKWEQGSALALKALCVAAPALGISLMHRFASSTPLMVIGSVASIVFSYSFNCVGEKALERRKEYWADSFAIKSSTNAELKGGLRHFEAMVQADLMINGEESYSWRSSHPSNRSRFKRIEAELKNRDENLDISSEADLLNIENMMCWEIRDSSCKIPQDKKPLFEAFEKRLNNLS